MFLRQRAGALVSIIFFRWHRPRLCVQMRGKPVDMRSDACGIKHGIHNLMTRSLPSTRNVDAGCYISKQMEISLTTEREKKL